MKDINEIVEVFEQQTSVYDKLFEQIRSMEDIFTDASVSVKKKHDRLAQIHYVYLKLQTEICYESNMIQELKSLLAKAPSLKNVVLCRETYLNGLLTSLKRIADSMEACSRTSYFSKNSDTPLDFTK